MIIFSNYLCNWTTEVDEGVVSLKFICLGPDSVNYVISNLTCVLV